MTPDLTQLARAIRATPNKGRTHVFLGHPDSDGGDKTVVEPGNTFSPGLWTCGVSLWVETSDGRLWTPNTQDFAWRAPHFGQIQRRVEWLERMMDADAPVRYVGENRLPAYGDTPGVNLLCLASQDGLIRGRMDWHSPDFYINCWAWSGFRLAAQAADELGRATLARAWADRADRLEDALAKHLLPTYGNERDPVVTPIRRGL